MLAFERLLDRLYDFDAEDAGVLSIYLQAGPSPQSGANHRAQLVDLLRSLRARIHDEDERARFDASAERAMEIADALTPLPRAVAIFLCPRRSFEVVVPLATPVVRQGFWGDRVFLTPLVAALDEHERSVVVLLDKARARIFQVCMGEIEELEAFRDEVPGKHRAGRSLQRAYQGRTAGLVGMGYDSPTIQRHHEWHVRQHVNRVLAAIQRRRRPLLGRIFLAGPVEALSGFRRLLPSPLRRRFAGELKVSMDASIAEVLAAVTAAEALAERAEELALVEDLFERPARTKLGAAAVTEAVADNQVHTLVYAEGSSMAGADCPVCGWLLVGDVRAATCPRCGGPMAPREDLIEVMLNRVLGHGGRVEEVRGRAAEVLRASEGVGAFLRWIPASTPVSS